MSDQTHLGEQDQYPGLGAEGLARLAHSSVLVAGLGATGGTVANLLARAGVGHLRLVDRDKVKASDLTRQLLYIEADVKARKNKAVVAARRIKNAAGSCRMEAVVGRMDASNAAGLMREMDLVIDGLDNLASRHVLNQAAVDAGLPWIHAACSGAGGNVLVVIPGVTPCLRCLYPEDPPEPPPGDSQRHGLLGPAPALAAAMAAARAVRLLAGYTAPMPLFYFDLWEDQAGMAPMLQGPAADCPVCGYLSKDS